MSGKTWVSYQWEGNMITFLGTLSPRRLLSWTDSCTGSGATPERWSADPAAWWRAPWSRSTGWQSTGQIGRGRASYKTALFPRMAQMIRDYQTTGSTNVLDTFCGLPHHLLLPRWKQEVKVIVHSQNLKGRLEQERTSNCWCSWMMWTRKWLRAMMEWSTCKPWILNYNWLCPSVCVSVTSLPW